MLQCPSTFSVYPCRTLFLSPLCHRAQAFDVPAEHGADGVTIVAFKKFDTPQVTFADELDAEKLTAFLHTEAMPLFGEIGPETYKKYVDRKLPLVYFFVDPNDVTEKAAIEAGKAVAAEFKGKLSLCSIDGVQYAKHGESLGVKATPMVVLHDMVKNKKYLTAQVTSADELRSFFSKWEAGTLIAHVKSEEIPERGTDAVQTLVGKNFESVAFDKTKDVLVEFYAPWVRRVRLPPSCLFYFISSCTSCRSASSLIVHTRH